MPYWREDRWASDTHYNEKFAEILKLNTDRLMTKDEQGEFSLAPEHFVGRDDVIAEIEKQLENKNNHIVLVNGIGGIGKTEICRVLVHRYRWEGHAQLRHLGWINYDGDLKRSLHNRIHHLTDTKEIELYWAQAVNLIKSYGRELLLIIDNANELSDTDRTLLNQLPCHRLLTSRRPYTGMRTIALGQLREEECMKLYRSYSHDTEASDEDILGLIELVDRHTLAIELLAKTQKKGEYSLAELRQRFEASQGLLRCSEKIEHGEQAPYIEHLAKIFDISGLQEEERRVLQIFFLLAKNTPLRRDDALKLLDIENLDLVNNLTDKGWLQGASMNWPVSATIRGKYPATPDQIEQLSLKIGYLMNLGNEVFTSKTPILPHTEQLIKQVSADSEAQAYLYYQCAFFYKLMADYKKALTYSKKAVIIRARKMPFKTHCPMKCAHSSSSWEAMVQRHTRRWS